jgi:methyl-accepting chemotaxis protein
MLSQQSALYAEMSSSVKSLADSINKIVGAVRGTTGEVEDLSNGLAAMAEAAVSGTNDIATATNNAINSSEEGARKAKATIEGLTSVSEEAGDALARFAKELAIKEATFNVAWLEAQMKGARD